jgi:hypothetical protein
MIIGRAELAKEEYATTWQETVKDQPQAQRGREPQIRCGAQHQAHGAFACGRITQEQRPKNGLSEERRTARREEDSAKRAEDSAKREEDSAKREEHSAQHEGQHQRPEIVGGTARFRAVRGNRGNDVRRSERDWGRRRRNDAAR